MNLELPFLARTRKLEWKMKNLRETWELLSCACGFGRVMKKREGELECCLYGDVRRYDDQKSTQVKSPRYGESRSCWKQKSRRGEGVGRSRRYGREGGREADGLEGEGVVGIDFNLVQIQV